MFCMVDRERFHPCNVRGSRLLSESDRDALTGYPEKSQSGMFIEHFVQGRCDLFGSFVGGEIVGLIAVFPDDTVTWLDVRPEFRNRGHGRTLLSACVEHKLQGLDAVYYDICLDNLANLRTALAVGFAPLRQIAYFNGVRR